MRIQLDGDAFGERHENHKEYYGVCVEYPTTTMFEPGSDNFDPDAKFR